MGSFVFCQVSLQREAPQYYEMKHNIQFSPFPIATENLKHFWVDAATQTIS